jgi:hypothetical protein
MSPTALSSCPLTGASDLSDRLASNVGAIAIASPTAQIDFGVVACLSLAAIAADRTFTDNPGKSAIIGYLDKISLVPS